VKLLRVKASGLTTSFRYPFFMMGRHPTFPMPPPATIYGHICSALGELVNPADVEFGYWFTCAAQSSDLEHIHLLAESGGTFEVDGQKYSKRVEGAVNPFQRDILFRPELILYLNRPEWLEAFRSPRYPVVLGRSQDLFTYTDVAVVDAPLGAAYLEHTLLPFSFQGSHRGTSVVMPRFIHYDRGREAEFEPYLVVPHQMLASDDMLTDPDTLAITSGDGVVRRRGIVLHGFMANGSSPS
jgi:CRISPR-associated protein Cas5t